VFKIEQIPSARPGNIEAPIEQYLYLGAVKKSFSPAVPFFIREARLSDCSILDRFPKWRCCNAGVAALIGGAAFGAMPLFVDSL
jgi:hypothetical protein